MPELPGVQEASAGLSFPDATFVVGILWQGADQTVGLDLEWQVVSADAVADGDHYLVALVDPSGAETILLDKTATYATVAPTPEQCSPSPTCRIAQLSP